MLYFHRGNVGQFGCFLIIRDLCLKNIKLFEL
jgi:hypothetical protein